MEQPSDHASTTETDDATRDTLFGGSLVLFQPKRGGGYRTNVDALILAAFASAAGATASAPVMAYDLGAGVGPIGLSLLRAGAALSVVFVEIDASAAALARRNLNANGLNDRGEVISADVAEVARARPGSAGLIVCNPPYVLPGRGQASSVEGRARVGFLQGFVHASRQLAGRRCRVCFIYPAQELLMLLSALDGEGLRPKRLRFVHPTSTRPARVALIEARAGRAGGLAVIPPLIERESEGYTEEMQRILTCAPSRPPPSNGPSASLRHG
jgi:tRNA1Val (adenine37-N6)-methyltransferase